MTVWSSASEVVGSTGSIIGIGIDVADTPRFERLLRRYGSRFTQRWFTEPEVARWRSADVESARTCALCFAVKEAVWKALRQDGARTSVPWRMITVILADDHRTANVALTGALLERSERSCVRSISVSLCTYGDVCLATAIVES